MPNILQVNFRYGVSAEDYTQAAGQLAEPFANVPGCRWKIWLIDESRREAGGIYLFDDSSSLEALLASPLMASVKAHPALSEFNAKSFEVLDAPTRVTRGPVAEALRA